MNDPVKHEITYQGAILVNDGYIHRQGKGIVAIQIDLKSKRAVYDGEFSHDSIPGVELCAGTDTLHIDESKREESTLIQFPEYPGWRVFAGNVSRYTLSVVLTEDSMEPVSIEQMCRDLLDEAIAERAVKKRKLNPQNMSAGDLTRMANLLTKFLHKEVEARDERWQIAVGMSLESAEELKESEDEH